MRRLASAIALLLLASTPASAFLAEVTTSVAVADVDDQGALHDALVAAVDDVLHEALAFTPTLVVLTQAAILGGRLYIRLLVADSDGERAFEELQAPPELTPAQPTELRI
ncbi:MAG: hypothetical protein E6K82_22020 [Candidatus Rokuibacteriota bacterium]|nr:MAG: hypothetical protein E6K82_22020 [Candidatus Rokubacteria bacterium]